MTVAIRAATVGDVDAVVVLERTIAEAPHWGREEYVRMLADPAAAVRRVLLIAERDAAMVGFAVGKVIGSGEDAVGELESVAVAEDARRLGAGRALCEAVIGWCAAQGAAVVELEVRSGSEGARALYGSLGFVEVGVRAGYYRDPAEDAVLMNRVDRTA
ncbi:MAG: GNAT family N-acetyltransferase [Edaphobacter sp.]|uniref:GNAT family N-acetyltransferase n=1 Tax=Edaphobacter sp. TaxID=1934404 RepID=UPI00238DD05C|nr:GNAT family N-acetyltransferase [Edaphobacter sp.]MDE1177559.1 GNAT family N-acetyltransferase [Edaphobacter sp.]